MNTLLNRLLGVAAAVSLTVAPVSAQPFSHAPARVPVAVPASLPAANGGGGGPRISTASDQYLVAFDSNLQALARTGGDNMVSVRLVTTEVVDRDAWQGLVMAVPRAQPDEASGLPVWYGRARAGDLAKLASLPFLVHASQITEVGQVPRFRDPDMEAPAVSPAQIERLKALAANPPANPAAPGAVDGWWDVGPGHDSRAAWEKGYTGSGVRVADIDSGVDFCHPDLEGTWAVYDKADSRPLDYPVFTQYPYEQVIVFDYYDHFDGWPMALSPVSNFLLFFDYFFNGAPTELNAFAYGISKFADTRATGTGGVINFDGRDYSTSGTASIFNPVYHIGYHPDTSLELVWGERVAVLVVDEDGDGLYETVYVDLNNNQDFSDDDSASQPDPTACWDADGDGYNDLSGGMVYFIADGRHWPQMMDWWWDPTAYWLPAPGAGELVAFMFDDPLGPAESHGTLVAGNIVGQGVIDGDPAVYGGEARPAWKPAGVGGMVQGAGKDVELVAIGDIYWSFEGSTEDAWYYSAFGVDGYGDTDDGVQIASNSYGDSSVDHDEWDQRSRLMTRLNTRLTYRGFSNDYGARTAFLVSTGNGGSGYGTITSASASTAIDVGASTQFGSTNGLDVVAGPGQVVWGDVVSFSNRGPTSQGHTGPDVTGDGAFAAGASTLNGWLDGWTAWSTWGGTSRSTPVAAGNLALVYDAWWQTHGEWPTWSTAKELLTSGAEDQSYDVLTQGAGSVNADLATDIAGAHYGVRVSPSEWSPGSFEGTDYLSFAQILRPGESDSQWFSAFNHAPDDVDVVITATQLTRTDQVTFTLQTSNAAQSPYAVTRPDYLFDVTEYAPGGVIPPGTDLMVAEIINPFDQFEPQGDSNNSNNSVWRVLWYSHVDLNANGRVWTDTNGNGVVNAGEEDALEYVRMNYGYSAHTYKQATVHDPLERWKDGIYLGLQHRVRQAAVPSTDLTIRVSFYQRVPWDWVTLDTEQLTVNGSNANMFQATVDVPFGTPYGLYAGEIQVSLPGDLDHEARTSVIPVVVNVAFEGDLSLTPVTLGGTERSDQLYDNGHVTGPQDWTWRQESGDWRFYFLYQAVSVPDGTHLIVRDEWAGPAPNTDLDTQLFGPAFGAYESGHTPLLFNFGDFSTLDPATFGPYRLAPIAASDFAYLGSGIWDFDTVTDGNVDYVAGDLIEGLHEVVNRTTRFDGSHFEVPFTKTVSTLTLQSQLLGFTGTLNYENYFYDSVKVRSNITHTQGLTVAVYGKSTIGEAFFGETITQDPTDFDECDFNAGGLNTYPITVGPDTSNLTVHVSVGVNDLDLFLLYDFASDGFDCPADEIAASTNSAGQDDEISVDFPAPGEYLVIIQGWEISSDPSTFDWYYAQDVLDNSIQMANADLSTGPANPAEFDLFNVPGACQDAAGECNDGVLFIGFPDAPALIEVPIIVEYTGANLESSTKTVNTGEALPGDVLTYTVTISNSSVLSDAVGVMVTDTLPSGVTFGGIVSGGATYNAGTNSVLWSGSVASDTVEAFAYTVTVDANVHHGTLIANYADVNNGQGGVTTIGPATTEINSIDLSASTKAVDKNQAAPGEILEYTITLSNTGLVAATGARITDTLPAHTSYVDASATNGAVYSPTLYAILWNGAVGSGDTNVVTFQVRLDAPLDAGAVITNTAVIDSGYGDVLPTEAAATTIVAGVLDGSAKLASADFIPVGGVVTFTVHVVNSGEVSTTVIVTDALPAGLTLVPGSATVVGGGPGSVVEVGNGMSYTGTLDALFNSEALIRYAATVDSSVDLCEEVTNTAHISDDQGHALMRSVTITVNCRLIWFPIVKN